MAYVDLHGHTTYSFLDGYGTPKQLAKRLKSIGRTACAITDHGNIVGHVDYEKNMVAAGIKPIFGCEFYVVDDMANRVDRYIPSLGADANPHVTVVAMNQTGYANLTKLSTLSYSHGFYHKPRIDWKTLAKHQDGLAVLSGCVGGFPSRLILGKGAEAAYDFVRERVAQIEHYYVELIPVPGLGISMQTFPLLMDIARDLNVPWVMTSDPHFPAPEDYMAEDTLVAIGMKTTVDDPRRTIKLAPFHYYCTDEELMQRARETMFGIYRPEHEAELQEAMDNSGLIADMCNVEIPKAKPMLYPGANVYPGGAAAMLWQWIEEGFDFRLKQGKLPPGKLAEYRERATMEFSLLKEKDFCDYILALADICRWAKAQDTLVMCRGSAGGCLVLWLIGASETDSIFLDLDFNRFMDITRNDPPDIDVDFEVSMKERVYEYIANKYGRDKVCQILALSLVRARVAVQDVASAHGIPREEYSALSARLDSKDDDVDKQIEGTDDPLALAVLEKYPIFRMIDQIVGQARNSTIHAAGVLISSEPLDRQIAIMEQPGKPRVSSVDKHGAAYLNYLKLDLLMVSAYDVLADAVRRIGANMAWLYSLPYDDPDVYRLAQSGRVAGVFQLDGAAIRIGHEIRLDVFEELIAASALCRPGAVEHVPTYKKNKFDERAFAEYTAAIHPIAQKNVAKTYGILIYQEQVMRMCNQMGNMPMSQVHKLRKRIASASFHGFALGPEYGDTFFAGCETNGVPRSEADYWWHAIKAHGIYCVSGDTVLDRGQSGPHGGGEITIAEYYLASRQKELKPRPERGPHIIQNCYTPFARKFRGGKCNLLQMDNDSRVRPGQVREIVYNGKAMLWKITTADGRSIRITSNHRMLTQRGYVECDDLQVDADMLVATGGYEKTTDTLASREGVPTHTIHAAVVNRSNGRCEKCGGYSSRYEVAHIKTPEAALAAGVEYHGVLNLIYLCNSCHKQLDYDKGERKTVWSKGRPTYYTQIVSIEQDAVEDTYCVVMDTENHNFVANGLVSHNSFNRAHAATYAIVGYWMLYMKTHYPDAYYESYLKHEGESNSRNELLMKRLIADYRRQGGEVVLIDPTVSRKSFYSPRKGVIVGGWGNLVGVGAVQADNILKGGPYRDWEHVRSKLPAGLYYKLHEAGVTGQVTFDQQAVIELAPWMPIIRTGDEEANIRMMYRLARPGALIPDVKSERNVVVCGYVAGRQIKARTGSFKGEQIIYTVEDEEGAVEWRVSSKNTELAATCKAAVKKGDFVALEGWWSGSQIFIKEFRVLKRRQ